MQHVFLHRIPMHVLLAWSFEQMDHILKMLPGDPQIDGIDNIHKIHVPNIQGRVFFRKKRAWGEYIDHGMVGTHTP